MSQNFAPVILLDEQEFWTPTVYLGKPYCDLAVSEPAVNIAYQMFSMGPARIAWVGEWSDMEVVRERYDVDDDTFVRFIKESKTPLSNDVVNNVFDISRRRSDEILAMRRSKYLINLDKKQYIRLEDHMGDFHAIDILPYMTLVSASETLSLDTVDIPFSGEWAFDHLQLVKSIPPGYQKRSI